MEKINYLRLLRRIVTVISVLVLLVACSAQVRAEVDAVEVAESPEAAIVAAPVVENEVPVGLTEENFSAVAVQLEAVARTDGRLSADRMLYAAFSSASALQVSESIPAAAAESSVNVIIVPEKKTAPTVKQMLPYAAVLLAAGVMFATTRRRSSKVTVYKPMRPRAAGGNPYAGYGMVRTYR